MKDDLTTENFKLFEELSNSEGNDKIQIRNKIFLLNMGLVEDIVKKYILKYQISEYEIDEYKQEGSEELIKAIEGFNHKLGNEFSTYAWIKIDGKIKDYILKYSGTIHIPKEKLQSIYRIKKAKAELEEDLGYGVNYEDLWEIIQGELELTREEFNQLIEIINTIYITSIDYFKQDQYEDDQDEYNTQSPYPNFVEQKDTIEKQELKDSILNNLNEREKLILNMLFGENGYEEHSNKEIAEILNLSPSSITRIIKRMAPILKEFGRNYDK